MFKGIRVCRRRAAGLLCSTTAALILTSCVAQGGTRVGDRQLSELAPGRSRYEEVVTKLGPPTVATAAPDGARLLIYKSERLKLRASTLIPLIGSFVGGAEEDNRWVTFHFDRSGVLTNWTSEAERKVHRTPGTNMLNLRRRRLR